LLRIGGATVALAAMFSLFVFPVRDYVAQSETLDRKESEIEALADANEQLQNEVNDLGTPEGIRNAARSQLGYVLPGETRIALAPMPDLPTTLPNAWPYTLISDIVAVRAEVVATTKNPLAPLGP
jgi:cell division protein FtsL